MHTHTHTIQFHATTTSFKHQIQKKKTRKKKAEYLENVNPSFPYLKKEELKEKRALTKAHTTPR